jgi:hypothetical protein
MLSLTYSLTDSLTRTLIYSHIYSHTPTKASQKGGEFTAMRLREAKARERTEDKTRKLIADLEQQERDRVTEMKVRYC